MATHRDEQVGIGCVCGCGRPASGGRGLWEDCYRRALKSVNAGQTSWAQLEFEGKALPKLSVKERRSRWTGVAEDK